MQRAAGPDPEAELVARPRRGARGGGALATVLEVGVSMIVAEVPQPSPKSLIRIVYPPKNTLWQYHARCLFPPTYNVKPPVPVEAAPRHAELEVPAGGEVPQPQSKGGLLAPVLAGGLLKWDFFS